MAQANGKPTPSAPPALQASYERTGAAGKNFAKTLPRLPAEPSTDERTAYLAALRAAVVAMQGEVNAFLTQKMEEDKKIAGTNGVKVDDVKEEENYGEEVVDEEE